MERIPPSLADLVEQMPEPDERGMYCTNINKEQIENAITEIHKGGRKSILALVDKLTEPGKADDVKARYALHVLAVYVCKLRDDRSRRQFAETLASQLGTDRPKAVQEYLIQQLQVSGGREVVDVLGKMLLDEDLCEPAAMALVAIRHEAAEQFRRALPHANGRQRLIIIQNLGVVQDNQSVSALREATTDDQSDVRIAATWALGNIGDTGSARLLLDRADKTQGWERIQATKASLLLAERLLASADKKAAKEIYAHLRDSRINPSEQYVRDAAVSALAEIG